MLTQGPFLEVLQAKPELFLTMVMLATVSLMMPLLMFLQILVRRDRFTPRQISQTVSEILTNSAIQQQISDGKINGAEFVQAIIGQLSPRPNVAANEPHKGNSLPNPFSKILHDITWDVSGIIGLLVTVVLLIAVVSRSYDNFPKEIIAGWTIILGFYFGKAVNPPTKSGSTGSE